MNKKYCFDLDGTLCTKDINYSDAIPYYNNIVIVNKLFDEGNIIIIETARGSVTGIDWESLTKTQLEKWGVKYHKLRVGTKIDADYYIDDKGINSEYFFKNIR